MWNDALKKVMFEPLPVTTSSEIVARYCKKHAVEIHVNMRAGKVVGPKWNPNLFESDEEAELDDDDGEAEFGDGDDNDDDGEAEFRDGDDDDDNDDDGEAGFGDDEDEEDDGKEAKLRRKMPFRVAKDFKG